MPNYQRIARNLLRSNGAIGTVALAAQQPGVGQPLVLYPQQPGVGALPAAAVPQLGQRPVDYTPAAYTAGGLTYCGLGRTLVPAGQSVQVHIDVRRPFLPQLFYMPSTIYGLQIDDFVVEGSGLFANPANQGIPNELVSEVSNIEQIQWMTLNPDTGGDFFVTNPTGAGLYFSGCFWGTNIIRNR